MPQRNEAKTIRIFSKDLVVPPEGYPVRWHDDSSWSVLPGDKGIHSWNTELVMDMESYGRLAKTAVLKVPERAVRTERPPDPTKILKSSSKMRVYLEDGLWFNINRVQYLLDNGATCVKCGHKGTYMKVTSQHNSDGFHLDLYGDKDGREVAITIDHKMPKASGGPDKRENFQPMCVECNTEKGHKIHIKFRGSEAVLKHGWYGNGRLALEVLDATDGQRLTVASTNLVDEEMAEDEIAIKDHSENEGMLASLMTAKVVSEPIRYAPSGFVDFPICKLLIKIPK